MPAIGMHTRDESSGARLLFALAYGGNGITYRMLSAGLLRAQIERRRHPLARLLKIAVCQYSGEIDEEETVYQEATSRVVISVSRDGTQWHKDL
jgi:hypothetical protein